MSALHTKNSSSFGGSASLHGKILKESTANGESPYYYDYASDAAIFLSHTRMSQTLTIPSWLLFFDCRSTSL
jgi:hypothetical protein